MSTFEMYKRWDQFIIRPKFLLPSLKIFTFRVKSSDLIFFLLGFSPLVNDLKSKTF